MAGSLLRRALDLVELLANHPRGLPLQTVAETLDIPKSGAHRLLAELAEHAYVVQNDETGRYLLTTKFATLGLKHLSRTGVVDIAQSVLNRLADLSGELARLAIVDYPRLVWVAKAQGSRSGLRFDGDMGTEARLSTTSTGIAWLASLSDEEALSLVMRQGLGVPEECGPKAPRTVAALMALVNEARVRGYAWVQDTNTPGAAAMAANILHPQTGRAVGNLSVAGPSLRLTAAQAEAIAPDLLAAAADLSAVGAFSDYLGALGGTAPVRQT